MGSSPKVPAAPDPVKTAQAQGQANIDAAKLETELNRYDQKTPFGSSTWSRDPADPNKWTNSYQLSPELQGMLGNVFQQQGAPNKQVDFAGLPGVQGADVYKGQEWSKMGSGINELGASAATMGEMANQSTGVASNAGNLANSQIDRLKELYGQDFNYDKLGAMPSASDATRKAVEDAYYKKATSRLDPQFANYEAEMRSRLANQGITEGSEAYNRELQEMMRGRTDAYGQATNDSILNSTTEMGKQFAMELAGRQQGVSEQNYIRELGTKEAQAAMGLYGDSSAINQGNRASQAGLLGAMSQLQNDAMGRAGQSQSMDYLTRDKALQEQLTAKGLQSQDRGESLQSLLALMNGGQMQAPGAGQTQVGAAPVAQSIYNSYQGQVDGANAAAGAKQSMWGTVGSLATSAAMMY